MTEYLAPAVFLTEIAFRSHPIEGGAISAAADPFAAGVADRSSGRLSNDQAPDWTTPNQHDPGVTLLELAAWVTESLAYRCDQFPLHVSVLDLLQVTSKYIGESEKNLGAAFKHAEQSGAALQFDEADALFGKRTEVRDSHGRYASQEANHLLQRIESREGVAILATNASNSIDPDILNRLRAEVALPIPPRPRGTIG